VASFGNEAVVVASRNNYEVKVNGESEGTQCRRVSSSPGLLLRTASFLLWAKTGRNRSSGPSRRNRHRFMSLLLAAIGLPWAIDPVDHGASEIGKRGAERRTCWICLFDSRRASFQFSLRAALLGSSDDILPPGAAI
jgi:hypothetical protein